MESEETKEIIIEIKDLSKSFGENHVLKHLNLNLYKGENLVVLGKSGSGKSVLIKCIIGLIKPDEGSILVFGQSIPELNNEELDAIRIKTGFLFQSNALYDSMTVRENLEFPLRRHNIISSKADEDKFIALIKKIYKQMYSLEKGKFLNPKFTTCVHELV